MRGLGYASQEQSPLITQRLHDEKMCAGLHHLCQSIPLNSRKLLIEVGSYRGESTEIFLQYFDYVVCIDRWWEPHVMKAFIDRIGKFGKWERVEMHRVDSVMFAKYSIFSQLAFADVVYLDTSHDYTQISEEIKYYTDSFNPMILCGHDYHPEKFPGVVKAVNENFNLDDVKIFSDTSWRVDLRK